MNKEEKEQKEAAAKADFERRMKQLQATAPPSDGDLLKSIAAVSLTPNDALELPSAAEFADAPHPANLPQETHEPPSRAERAASRINPSNDPKLETLLDTIADQVKAQRLKHSAINPRVLVKAYSDIFYRVSRVSFSRRLDKTEILTYLLSRYLPEEGRQEPPAWLVQERPDDVLNAFHLVYQEDSEIAARFTWLEQRFGLLKVDIVAAIVTRYLPASLFTVPPKRRARRKRF
jgi:hypothetical protein